MNKEVREFAEWLKTKYHWDSHIVDTVYLEDIDTLLEEYENRPQNQPKLCKYYEHYDDNFENGVCFGQPYTPKCYHNGNKDKCKERG